MNKNELRDWVISVFIGGTLGLGFVAISIGAEGVNSIIQSFDRNSRKYERPLKESERPVVGTVLEKSYKNTYTLKVQTDDGKIIGVSVIDGDYLGKNSSKRSNVGTLAKEKSLDAIIEKGTRISFPAGNMWYSIKDPKETYFTRADRIKVLQK